MRNRQGKLAIDEARAHSNEDIVAMLSRYIDRTSDRDIRIQFNTLVYPKVGLAHTHTLERSPHPAPRSNEVSFPSCLWHCISSPALLASLAVTYVASCHPLNPPWTPN